MDAFATGLKVAGYEVVLGEPVTINSGDIMVTWNRYGWHETLADRFERAGGTVIVAENGYLNPGGGTPKYDAHESPDSKNYYALSLHGHNGSGSWPDGGRERWDALGIQLKPWKTDGEIILICPSRPFGSRSMTPPIGWTEHVVRQVTKTHPRRFVRVRPHPGNNRPGRSLAEDLENCKQCIIWASSSGVHALVAGVPVQCWAPYWICQVPYNDWSGDNRERALQRMAWAQWNIEEITTGEPFVKLAEVANA